MSNSTTYYEALSKMPPLRHSVGEVFDIEKSEVVAWVVQCPGFKDWLFSKISHTGRIVYDPATGTWSGAPYRKPLKGFKEWKYIRQLNAGKGGRPKAFADEELLKVLGGGAKVSELAVAMNCSRTTVVTALKRLEAAGRVRRDGEKWLTAQALMEDVDA